MKNRFRFLLLMMVFCLLLSGSACGKDVTDAITDRIGWIAGVTVIPGEREMLALAQGAYRVLSGEEEAQVYE